jgi:cell division protein FtsZ
VAEDSVTVKVVGVGGSGCSILEKTHASRLTGCEFIAMSTDARTLLECSVSKKLLLGRKTTGGRSTGNNIRLGEKAALEEWERINEIVSDADVVFIVAGIGGGTGAGATPVVAEAAKNHDSIVVALVNTPFSVEGKACRANAVSALENLKAFCDMIILVENDRLLEVTHSASINESFSIINELVLDAIKNLIKLALKTDAATTGLFTGMALIASGSGASPAEAASAAFGSPLFSRDINGATGVLMSFTVHSAEALEDVSGALDVASSFAPNAGVLWFPDVSSELGEGVVEIFVLVSGLDFKI